MQKIISVNIIKPMIPVIKSKLNTKIQRKVNALIEKEKDKKYFKKERSEIEKNVRESFEFSSDIYFVEELELCVKNPGDLILTASEVLILNELFEEEI